MSKKETNCGKERNGMTLKEKRKRTKMRTLTKVKVKVDKSLAKEKKND